MKKISYLILASITLLTACAPKTPQVSGLESTPSQSITTQQQQAIVTKSTAIPSSFELSGGIAAKSHKKGWTATANWKQSGPNQYQISLMGPLGGQSVMIEKQNGVVSYREGNKKLTSNNADDLLQKQTGIRLPVSNLYYWVRGIPAPGAVQSATRNANNQLVTLRQAGYTIDYTDYMSAGSIILPHKIRLQGHDVMVKLVIKRWAI
ncbi:MAG: lipoprotein insertase outer membrane protein LolB [Legionellaceae bacterium]|nr:lipoprotein insertase outer membrane protein LolB [Legionellaceae bacterium]